MSCREEWEQLASRPGVGGQPARRVGWGRKRGRREKGGGEGEKEEEKCEE